MPSFELNEAECQQILNILGDVPWRIANPLLMKIGQQLQAQQQTPALHARSGDGKDTQEVHHE